MRAAGQRDAQRARRLPGADIGADQRHQRRAEAEHQRDQQIFEPRAGAVAGDRVGPGGGADQRRRQRHRQRRLQRAHRADRADAQDVGEQRPAQPRQPQPHEAAARTSTYQPSTARGQRRGERPRPCRRRRCRAPGTGPTPKISSGESGTSSTTPTQIASDGTSMLPVPRITLASAFISQTSTVPANTTFEYAQRRVERRAVAAQRAVERRAEGRAPAPRRPGPSATLMTMRVQHQRVGVVAPAAAERAGDRRGDAAAHRAGRQHLHHHEAGKHQRHAGQRVGAEARHPPGLDQPGRGLRQHHQHVGPGQAQQRRHDRPLQQQAGARAERGRRRSRRGGVADENGHEGRKPARGARLREGWVRADFASRADRVRDVSRRRMP